MTLLKNFAAALIGMLVGTAAMAATQWGQSHEIRDVLNCRTSKVVGFKNAEGESYQGDQIQIVQNQNRSYATLRVNGQVAGLASYGRSRTGQITVRGWDVKFGMALKAVDSQGGYAAQNGNVIVACALTRAQFQL